MSDEIDSRRDLDTSETSEAPETSETSETPETSETSETPETSETSEPPESKERPVSDGTATDPRRRPPRRARLDRHATPGPRNSLWSWTDAKSPLTVVRNYLVIVLARISPSLRLKNWLLRRLGVTVGSGVSWGLESTPDVFWPERITVGDDAIIGYDATLLCHEFLHEEYRLGDVVVEDRAMIGAGAVVLPGVTIGEGARVAANSLVADDVPPATTVAGVPAKVVSERSDASAD